MALVGAAAVVGAVAMSPGDDDPPATPEPKFVTQRSAPDASSPACAQADCVFTNYAAACCAKFKPKLAQPTRTYVFVDSAALRQLVGDHPALPRSVDLELCIDTTGAVASVAVPEDLDADLAKTVTDAVSAWRYVPYQRNGVAVDACTHLTIPAGVIAKTFPGFVEQAVPTLPPICDEVSCVLDYYVPACCAKFYKGGPRPTRPPARLPEQLDRAAILDGMTSVKPAVMACGDKLPSATGSVKVRLKIDPGGNVSSATSTPDDALGRCVAAEVKKAKFAKSQFGVSVAYPYVLRIAP